jgi:hypothetical protein
VASAGSVSVALCPNAAETHPIKLMMRINDIEILFIFSSYPTVDPVELETFAGSPISHDTNGRHRCLLQFQDPIYYKRIKPYFSY